MGGHSLRVATRQEWLQHMAVVFCERSMAAHRRKPEMNYLEYKESLQKNIWNSVMGYPVNFIVTFFLHSWVVEQVGESPSQRCNCGLHSASPQIARSQRQSEDAVIDDNSHTFLWPFESCVLDLTTPFVIISYK